jgi:hypothetical protein
MTNRDIYSTALGLLAQNIDGEENGDLEDRAPYILASFCSEVFEIDRLARRLLDLSSGSATEFSRTFLPLDGEFPLLERFASAAAKYLAAMLIIDEDSELSDKLYDMYCDSMATLQSQLPSVIEKIVNKYI